MCWHIRSSPSAADPETAKRLTVSRAARGHEPLTSAPQGRHRAPPRLRVSATPSRSANWLSPAWADRCQSLHHRAGHHRDGMERSPVLRVAGRHGATIRRTHPTRYRERESGERESAAAQSPLRARSQVMKPAIPKPQRAIYTRQSVPPGFPLETASAEPVESCVPQTPTLRDLHPQVDRA